MKPELTDMQAAPLTDLIVSTPSARNFHRINLRQNPSHYPLMARIIGSGGITWIQENWGARVWYVTMVQLLGKVRSILVTSAESVH
jgi:translocator assembly and maintenance protein 41